MERIRGTPDLRLGDSLGREAAEATPVTPTVERVSAASAASAMRILRVISISSCELWVFSSVLLGGESLRALNRRSQNAQRRREQGGVTR